MDAAVASQVVGEDLVDSLTASLPTIGAVLCLFELGTEKRFEVVIYDLRH